VRSGHTRLLFSAVPDAALVLGGRGAATPRSTCCNTQSEWPHPGGQPVLQALVSRMPQIDGVGFRMQMVTGNWIIVRVYF
jgi:hypothetical protein